MILPLPRGARLVLRTEDRRKDRWRADLLQPALALGPEGPRTAEAATDVARGIAAGDADRAAVVLRRLGGADRAPLERLLALLGPAIAAEAGLVGRLAWTLDADEAGVRLLDRHGTTRAVLPLLVPGWADLPGARLEAGRGLCARLAVPNPDSAHGRVARRHLLRQDLAHLGLPPDLPERLGVAAHLDG